MANGVTVHITGLDQLAKTLEQDLPEKMARGIIRDAMQAGGEAVRVAAEASAPVRSGELKGDIVAVVRISNTQYGMAATCFIGPAYDRSQLKTRKRGRYAGRQDSTTSPGIYAVFVEKGHAPAGMAQEKRRARRSGTEIEFGGRDTPPHPWLSKAFDTAKGEALDAIVSHLRSGIEAAARELAKKK